MMNEHKKILRLVEDLNDYISEKDSIFEEAPLSFATTGYASLIDFCNNRIFFSEEHCTFHDLLKELLDLEEKHTLLLKYTNQFFKKMTNKEIEEKYGIGIEMEE